LINGHLREAAIKVIVGVTTASIISGGVFAFRINDRVTIIEERQDRIREDIYDIKLELREITTAIQDLPRGEGGLSGAERSRLNRMEEDIACIRGMLSGQRTCPP
jgi:hypothetical protein